MMVVATAWRAVPGWDMMNMSSNLSIVNASMQPWQQSGEGFGAVLVFGAIILLLGGMIYIRTQKTYPTVMMMLFATYIVDYYGLLDITVYSWSGSYFIFIFYILEVLLLAISMVYDFKSRD